MMEFFDSTKKPVISHNGHSVDVLIDLDGKRKDFQVGWYDFDAKEWRFYSDVHPNIKNRYAKSILWAYLPLAELDNIKL